MTALTQRSGTVAGTRYTAYDQGAHLAQWSVEGAPVVWVSEQARYAVGEPIRGGVPVCWPWFADGPDGRHRPAHGFARTAPWTLVEQEQGRARHRLTWQLTGADTDGLPGAQTYPTHFRLALTADIGPDLALTLAVRNTGDDELVFEAALHTYLAVGDVRQVEVLGLEGAGYYDKVLGRHARQEGPVRLEGETDRVYERSAAVVVDDPVQDRQLRVTPVGATHTVVWNPWADKAGAMADFGEQEWTGMLCVETARVGRDAVRLAAGQEHRMTARIETTGRDAR